MTNDQLRAKADQLRRDVARMIGPEKVGHLGGSCSLADIVAVLYYKVMRHDPARPGWEGRDRFLLSKGHAALIQYAALGDLGYYFPREEAGTLKALGSRLQGHPDMRLPGIEANTGSLGQGLSIACGMAAGVRLSGLSGRVYCCVGDGELAEGQIWEAAMSASAFALANLTVFVDSNGLQATGTIRERFGTHPHGDKFRAFGWHVERCDGHDVEAIQAAIRVCHAQAEKPSVILARTVKGKGFAFAENNAAFHNGAMTRAQYEQAISHEPMIGGEGA